MNLIMGVIPCKDRYWLDLCLPLIRPGVEELAEASQGEFTYYGVASEIFAGTMQLYMAYVNEDPIPDDKFQEVMVGKLNTPVKDFAGFVIIQLLPTSLHVHQAYLMPDYRNKEILAQGAEIMKKQAKLLGAPRLTMCTRSDVAGALMQMGFKETYTTYSCKL